MKHLRLSLLVLLAGAVYSRAQLQIQRLYTSSMSSNPPTCLVQGNDGNYYGTFIHEGFFAGNGTVFKLTAAGSVTTGGPISGLNDGLTLAQDGNLYGTTTNGYGTIFKVS